MTFDQYMARRNKIRRSLLEYLPNELFEEIFSYLNGVNIIYAFSQLNCRFQCLLCNGNYQFWNFHQKTKDQFDRIFQISATEQCKLLKLFNDDYTYGQIDYFFQNYSLIEHFSSLEFFSMISSKSLDESLLLTQLPFLSNLVSLTLKSICGEKMSQFNLPNLKKLSFASCTNTNWIRNFSQVETIEYTIINCYKYERNLIWPSNLQRLKVIFSKNEDSKLVQQSLIHSSQLITLEIYQKERDLHAPDGHQWEELIRRSLPLLKNFKFYFQFDSVFYTFEHLQQIIMSFQTSFYQLEKQWSIRCDICYRDRPYAAIYSLPFPFDRFSIFTNLLDQSISSSIDYDIYANVKSLVFEEKSVMPDANFNQTCVSNLIINTHFEPMHWTHVLTKLKCLEIQSGAIFSAKNLVFLFQNSRSLHALVIEKNLLWSLTENWSKASICKCLSKKIRLLNFISNGNQSQCLNIDEVKQIIGVFALRCRHLSLCIYSDIEIIRLILQKMKKLNSLHIRIQGQDYPPITIEWLNKKQSHIQFTDSNCFIVNDGCERYFWLGKHA